MDNDRWTDEFLAGVTRGTRRMRNAFLTAFVAGFVLGALVNPLVGIAGAPIVFVLMWALG